MVEKHVVSGLVERRARVAGELRKAKLRVMALKADLGAIDSCVRMFKEDYRPEIVEPKTTFAKNPAGLPKGTGSRKALEILRVSGEPLTAPELARRISNKHGPGDDRQGRRNARQDDSQQLRAAAQSGRRL